MKLIIAFALVGACAGAFQPYVPGIPQNYQNYANYPNYRPTYQERPRAALERNAAILRSVSDINENGYAYAYDTENGISAEERGVEANGIQAQGGYTYTGDDGVVYSIQYTADSNGFQARGAHIPTPPPIPAEIAKSLADNARDEASGIFDDGSYQAGKYDAGVFAARVPFQPRPYTVPGYRPVPRRF